MCPFVLLSPGLLSYWPDLGWGEKSAQGLFFDESLNRTKTEGGVKEKIQCPAALSPLQFFLKTLQYYITYTEKGLAVNGVSSSPNGGQPLHATLCHNIKGHALSTFKLPGRHNRARS